MQYLLRRTSTPSRIVMTDLFTEKAQDWDTRTPVQLISSAVGATLLEQIALRPDMEVMDFGAGTGLISSHVASQVARIVAVDVSASMLEKLREKPELQGKVETVCQDIVDQPLQRSFDLIMSAMALHHVEDTARLFQRFAENLHPGGQVALADLDTEDGTFHAQGNEGVFHFGFDRAHLSELLTDNGFTDIQFQTPHVVRREAEGREYPLFFVRATRT
jgi:putative AdoMet-dependent methyltransferase